MEESASATGDRFLLVVGVVVVGAGLVLGVVRFAGASPAENGVEGILASVTLAAVVAAPGLLTLVARRGRPVLLAAAGSALLPLSLLALSGVMLPLVIPAVMLLVGYSRRRGMAPRPRAPVALTTAFVLVCLGGAVVVLLGHADPRTYTTSNGSGSTSDIITYPESLGALSLVCMTVFAAAWLGTPQVSG